MVYRGYGSPTRVYIIGHVIRDRLVYEMSARDNFFKNFRGILSRYINQPIAGLQIKVGFMGKEKMVKTNRNGYFEAVFDFDPPLTQSGWHPFHCEVIDPPAHSGNAMKKEGEVHLIDDQVDFGIISDIDDTVLVSKATTILPKLFLMVSKNSKTRLPFEGVAGFYQALRSGNNGSKGQNPLFYVSSSEWNLYDFLVDFFHIQDIPKGPFLLQQLKTNLFQLVRSGGGTHNHKMEKILHLMELFEDLKFVLIGDSGQRDAELYARVAQIHPDRILAIYIRDVTGKKKDEWVKSISQELHSLSIDMVLVKDTQHAAQHAMENDFISQTAP